MTTGVIRMVSVLALVVLLVAYAWITLRTDGRMMTIPFLPHWLKYHLELHAYTRNFPAFFLLSVFGAGAVVGLKPDWKVLSLALCLFAPLAKDLAQIFVLTRHFNWTATCWGIAGALVGWVAAALLLRMVNAK
jgi:hypothetical protein